jgi:hypothetical protein
MRDKPDAADLLDSVEAFLTDEVVPALEGRQRFHALVSANVVRIVARELRLGASEDRTELRALWDLLGREGEPPESADTQSLLRELNAELCERVERGEADEGEFRRRVEAYLLEAVVSKLRIDDPAELQAR